MGHIALLRFGRPEFESLLADLSRSRPPISLSHFASSLATVNSQYSIQI